MERIVERGAVISEFSSRCPTVPGNFPRRNRIIAACSTGVLVVQAGAKSGALRTADWALELGLDVWAVPGEISNPLREGVHRLIKQGAHLVTTPEDVLPAAEGTGQESARSIAELYAAGHHPNQIAALLNLPIQQVLAQVSLLQLGVRGEQAF